MGKPRLESLQKSAYLRIVNYLWDHNPKEAHEEYPDVSTEEFCIANDYYDSKRCPGCWCGSCVGLSDLSSNLPSSPKQLKPIADLAIKLGQQEFDSYPS
jgi:hypothetical protein